MAGMTGLEPVTSTVTAKEEGRSLQKTSVTDGFFWRWKRTIGNVIEPISTHDLGPENLCPPIDNRVAQNAGQTLTA